MLAVRQRLHEGVFSYGGGKVLPCLAARPRRACRKARKTFAPKLKIMRRRPFFDLELFEGVTIMQIAQFFDPLGLALVAGGSLAATLARVGLSDMAQTGAQLRDLARSPFDLPEQRAHLARSIARLNQDGLVRFSPSQIPDRELSKIVDVLCITRSVEAFLAAYQTARAVRLKACETAAATLEQAAELAPLFGLVGTLFALSQLPQSSPAEQGAITGTVSLAVVSTLYGLLLAHFLIMPLASAVRRRRDAEDADRTQLIEWIAEAAREANPAASIVNGPDGEAHEAAPVPKPVSAL